MTADLSLLPLGTSDFTALRADGQIYVDKTELVCRLASGCRKVLLTRPRRFGKSLLVSTFESLFKYGLRDFGGLAIESLWKDEGRYLVVRLDFSVVRYFTSIDEFKRELCALLVSEFEDAGFSFVPSERFTVHDQLSDWLGKLPINALVLLIDEYDAPLTACLGNVALFKAVERELSNFYAALQSNDGVLRFLFTTGITKFNNDAVFSGLKNLTDISLLSEYGTLLGFTRNEVEASFGASLENAAEVQKMSKEALTERLAEQYGGYCFSKDPAQRVSAPWPVLMFLCYPDNGFRSCWIESGGSPLKHMKPRSLRNPESFAARKSVPLGELTGASGVETLSDMGLLAQAGYLTIRKIAGTTACLDYPNAEVRTFMARLYTGLLLKWKVLEEVGAENAEARLAGASPEDVCRLFNGFFGSMDDQAYPVRDEASVRAFVQVLLAGVGLEPKAEIQNVEGRCGLEVRAGHRLWLFEFRVARDGESAEARLGEALDWIEAKTCGLQQGLELIRMALVFSVGERRFVQWAVVE